MAEAITADILEGQKELIKKVTFIGNVLNKNIVPKSKQKEKDIEDNAWKKKLFGFMSGFQDQFEGMKEAFKTRAKAAGGGLLSMLKKGALLLAIPAILALLNSDIWTSIKDWFVDDLMPALEKMWTSLKELWIKLKPHLEALVKWAKETALPFIMATIVAAFTAVTGLLDDITLALSGDKGWVSVLTENKAALAAIALLLFPKTAFALVKAAAAGVGRALTLLMVKVLWPMARDLAVRLFTAVVNAATALRTAIIAFHTSVLAPMIKSLAVKGLGYIVAGAKALRAGIIAMNAQILAPMLVALGPALIVAAPFILIAAAVALAVKSLYDAFTDAKAIFDDTGDIWAALSTGLSSFLATFMGFIPDMVKNIVAWGLDKLGFDAAAEWLRSFSIVESLKGMFKTMFDGVISFLGLLFSDPLGLAYDIWGFVKSMPGKVWDWIKTTVLGWFGLKTEDEKISGAVDDVEKPEANWLQTMFANIFPEWLLHPVKWIMGKLGIKEGDTVEDGSKKIDAFASGVFASIADLFVKIFPEWLTSPVSWAMKKLGLTNDSGALTDAGSTLSETLKTAGPGGLAKLIGDLFVKIFPEWITSPIEWIKGKIFGAKQDKLTDTTADSFFSDWKLPSWESFKDMMPDWLRDPVGWVTGLFKRGKKAGFEEKQKILQEETQAGGQEIQEGGMSHDQAIVAYQKAKAEAGGGNIDDRDLVRANKEAVDFYSDQARQMGLMIQTSKGQFGLADDISAMSPAMARALQSVQHGASVRERKFTKDEDKEAIVNLAKQAKDPGSLYVHDTHVEKTLQQLIQPMLNIAAAQSALLAAYGGGSSGGGTTVNNVTVAPSTSNTVSSVQKSENTYGTVDPYTSAAGAYG